MSRVVEICLMQNNTNFIKILIDSGFPLHEELNDELMAELYMRDFNSRVRRIVGFLRQR